MDPRCELSNFFNYTLDEEAASEDLFGEFASVSLAILMPIILSVGILSNLTFFLMLYRVPKMRTITNFYLANLAVSDIIFLLFAISAKVNEYRVYSVSFHPVSHGVFSCLLKFFVVDLSFFASLFIITLVSLEKYYAICRPLQHRLISGWDRTVKLTIVAWLVSLIFAISVIPSYCKISYYCFVWPRGEPYDAFLDVYAYCDWIAPWTGKLANVVQTMPFFLALFINTTLYVLIVKRLTKRIDEPTGQQINAHNPQHAVKMRNQVGKMLVVNGIIFFLLLAPFEIVSLLLVSSVLNYTQQQNAILVGQLLSYVNSATNPFVYGMMSSRYRQAFKVTLSLKRNNRVNIETTQNTHTS